jgi:hypothetical protein
MTSAIRLRFILFSLLGLSLVAPIFWCFYRPIGLSLDIEGHPLGVDFANIWAGPRIAAQHGVMILFNYETYHDLVAAIFGTNIKRMEWSYPPTMLLFATPLSLMPYHLTLIAWTFSGFALYAAVVLHRVAPAARPMGLIFLLLAPASLVNIVVGQNGFFTAAIVLGGVVLLERRPWLAGVLFGLLVVKPHLALLVPVALAAVGAWRTIVAAALTAGLLVGASAAAWGIDAWITWWTRTCAHIYLVLAQFEQFHTYMMPSVFASARAIGLPPDVANVVQAVVAVAVVLAAALVFRRTRDLALRALLLTSGAFLVSPYVFNYDMTAMTGALLWVMVSTVSASRLDALIFGAAWVLPGAIWYMRPLGADVWSLIIFAVFVSAVAKVLRVPRSENASIATEPLPAR